MNRFNYYSNGARFLGIGALILCVAKIILTCGSYFPDIIYITPDVSGKITDISFYGFLVLSFLSFNGESSFLKKSKDYRKRFFTVNLRRLVFLNIFMALFKNSLVVSTTSRPLNTFGGMFSRIFLSLLISVCVPSFVLFGSSVYYFIRDRKIKKLFPLHIAALVFSALYFIVKLAGNMYMLGADFFGKVLTFVCTNTVVSDLLCIFQYICDVVLLFSMYKLFDVKADEYDALSENEKKITVSSLFNDKGFGIDDADLLLSFGEIEES